MFDKRRYLRNILFNWGSYFASLVIGFMVAPYVVRNLGDLHYGYWALILTSVAYFPRLDLGIQSAVSQYISRHLADGDTNQLNDKANSALTAMLVVGLAAALACVAGSAAFTRYFHVAHPASEAVRLALILVGLSAAAKLPFTVFQAMLVGTQRFDIMSGVGIGIRALNASLLWVVLGSGYGISGLAAVVAGTQLLEGALLIFFARRAVPQVRIRPFHFRRQAFADLFHYGAFNFVINLAAQVGNGIWAVILARKLGADEVTYFSIGYEVIPYMVGVANAATLPLLQSVIPMDVRQDEGSIRKMFLAGSRWFFALVCLMGVNLLLVGERFIGQWMGAKYLDPEPYGSSGLVLVLLTLANIAALSSSVAQQILFARRKNRLFAILTVAQTAAIIALALILVPRYGILGMAIAMLVPLACVEGMLIPVLAARHVRGALWEYWLKAILPNLAVTVAVYGLGRYILPYIPGSGWPAIALSFACVTALQVAFISLFIAGKAERRAAISLIRGRLDTDIPAAGS